MIVGVLLFFMAGVIVGVTAAINFDIANWIDRVGRNQRK
jgi:hypothetical protein